MRQSGSALRKLIRSVAVAGVASWDPKAEERFPRRTTLMNGDGKHNWNTLLIGSEYRATDYRDLLAKHEISCSMSAKSCCWDNAVVESFFSTLKLELKLDLYNNREEPLSPQQL